jgi:autotransporter-associated beta strand protein
MKRVLLIYLTAILFLFTCLMIPISSFSQLYWGGSGGAWNSAGWSATDGGPFVSNWIANSLAVFNVPNSSITGASIAFSSIMANENVVVSNSGTIATGGSIATITVAAGKTFDFGSQQISSAAGTGFIKNGDGVLAISGGSYPGGLTLNNGSVIARGVNAFGTGILTINGGTIATTFSTGRDFSDKMSSITISGNFNLGATTGLASSTGSLIFNAPVNLGNSLRTLTLNGTGTNTFAGVISGAGGIAISSGSTGTLLLSGNNDYNGATILSGGTLTLGAAEVIPDGSPVTFNGGTLKTGAFSENYATLNVSEHSTIILAASSQSHTFAASNAIPWTAGKTLTITGWAGGYNGTSGTNGKIFVGNTASGLTPQQLSQIKFFNGSINVNAEQLATGEIVPNVSVLPISLTTFTAKPINKSIILHWQTASETHNQYFELQRSANGKSFTKIATVNGAVESHSEKSYSFIDENPFAGTNYYKLMQYDTDGKSTSKTISVDSKLTQAQVFVSATPSAVALAISSPNTTKAHVYLYDLEGSKIAEKKVDLNKGGNSIQFEHILSPGIYFVSLVGEGARINVKFVKPY